MQHHRRTLAVGGIASLMTLALLADCTTTPHGDLASQNGGLKIVKSPHLRPESARLIFRHVNSLLVYPVDLAPRMTIVDIFWSQSCGDTMRAYADVIRPVISLKRSDIAFVLHLVPRGTYDLWQCVLIRRVPPETYGEAVFAVLDEGARRKTFVPARQFAQLVKPFFRPDSQFIHGFAENCAKQMQKYALSLGVTDTPGIFVNGARANVTSLKRFI